MSARTGNGQAPRLAFDFGQPSGIGRHRGDHLANLALCQIAAPEAAGDSAATLSDTRRLSIVVVIIVDARLALPDRPAAHCAPCEPCKEPWLSGTARLPIYARPRRHPLFLCHDRLMDTAPAFT